MFSDIKIQSGPCKNKECNSNWGGRGLTKGQFQLSLHSILMEKILSHGDREDSSDPYRGPAVFRGSAYPFLTPHWLFLTSFSTSRKEQATLKDSILLSPLLYLRAVWRSRLSSSAGIDCQLTSLKPHPLLFSNTHTIQKHLRLLILSLTLFSYQFCQLYSPSLSRFIYLHVLSHHSAGTRES